MDMIQTAEELARPTSIGSIRSEASSVHVGIAPVNRLGRRKKSGFLRRDTGHDSSDLGNGKASTLERIVRGLARLGSSQQLGYPKKMVYYNDAATSDEDIKMRYAR